jgi:hypothetical protein
MVPFYLDTNIPEIVAPSLEETSGIIETLKRMDLSSVAIDDVAVLVRRLFTGCSGTFLPIDPGAVLYRATKINAEPLPEKLGRLSYPPKECVWCDERCNRKGQPLFYASMAPNATLWEIGADVGDYVIVSKWRTLAPMHLMKVGYTTSVFERFGAERSIPPYVPGEGVSREVSDDEKRNHDVHTFLTNLFMQIVPRGQEYRYKISICVAEMLMADNRMAGLIYPSIAMYANADNVALKPTFVDGCVQFEFATCFAVSGVEAKKVTASPIAVCNPADQRGALKWDGYGQMWSSTSGTVSYVLPHQDGPPQ